MFGYVQQQEVWLPKRRIEEMEEVKDWHKTDLRCKNARCVKLAASMGYEASLDVQTTRKDRYLFHPKDSLIHCQVVT
jgi:hypothetical protein